MNPRRSTHDRRDGTEPMTRISKFIHARADVLALTAYGLLTVLMTLPVATRLTTHLVGWGNDPYVHYWNNWWVAQALKRGISPYYTDMLFHPDGASMVFHNFSWLNIAGALVLKPLAGPVGAYNLVFLANIALCGFAMYQLAGYVVGHRGAAFVAGLVHAFWPYRLHHSAHPNLISTQWMVWFLLFLMKTVREGRRRDALLAGLFLAFTAFARLQLLILAAFPAAIYLVYSLFAERERWNWGTVGRLAMIGAMTGALLAYPLSPLLQEYLGGEHPGDVFIDEQSSNQSDLLAYIVPNHGQPIRKEHIPKYFDAHVVFLGYTALALAIFGAVKAREAGRLWLVMAGFAFIMALGPTLRVAGKVVPGIPLPYRLVGWTFPVRILRNPHRFNILLALPVAVLVGFGTRGLWQRRTRLLPPLVAGLVLFEYVWFPMSTLSLEYSPFYDRIAEIPETFGLYDLPMGFSGPAKFYMYLQTIHGKPIVQGKMSRPLRTINDFIDGDPFTKHLRLTKNRIDPDLTAISRHLEYLADAGVRYIVLHRDPQLEERRPSDEHWAAWQDWLVADPVYEDDRIAVHPTRLEYGRDFAFEVELDTDVGVVHVGHVPDILLQGNILEFELVWGSRDAPRRDLKARLSLVDGSGVAQQSLTVEPCPDWPTGDWPANALAIGHYAIQIDPHLPPDRYDLVVELVGKGEAATLAPVTIESLPRTFEPPTDMAHSVDALFDDEIELLGYDLARREGALQLTLHWRALERPDGYYKIFVHVLDSRTGSVVAQHDAVPRDWTYPTNWWEAGEVVTEQITLKSAGLPTGRSEIEVGMYDPGANDRRLPIRTADGTPVEENRLVLALPAAR